MGKRGSGITACPRLGFRRPIYPERAHLHHRSYNNLYLYVGLKVCVWDKGETIKSTQKSFEEKQKDVAEKKLKNISYKNPETKVPTVEETPQCRHFEQRFSPCHPKEH